MTLPAIAVTAAVGPSTGSGTDAPTLVLGPSLGTSTLLWERVIPALAERYRVVAWDLPGHGAARAATEPFTIAELADAVAEAVEGPFLYAGVSLGGCVGLELLRRHRDRIGAAAIICSGAAIGAPQGCMTVPRRCVRRAPRASSSDRRSAGSRRARSRATPT
ncbi:MAG TPA: alpha/beta fold hydrolase [Microbacterium sp.]|uniref:alpha/beta fold hydrolase n=1 Tax=Microbacterium sp. TaxID=51671 RepID=UPI002F939843